MYEENVTVQEEQIIPEAEPETQEAETPEEERELTPEEQKLEKRKKQVTRDEKTFRHLQGFILRLVIFMAVLWVMFFVIIGLIRMPNADMYPRIDAGDLLMFYRLDKDVKFQDVIVFTKGGTKYVGRVVAVQGDEVDIPEHGGLVVNGNALSETNIFYSTQAYEGYTTFPLKLEEGQCFVLSDHRKGGEDSRYFGPVDKSEIMGTVISLMRRNTI